MSLLLARNSFKLQWAKSLQIRSFSNEAKIETASVETHEPWTFQTSLLTKKDVNDIKTQNTHKNFLIYKEAFERPLLEQWKQRNIQRMREYQQLKNIEAKQLKRKLSLESRRALRAEKTRINDLLKRFPNLTREQAKIFDFDSVPTLLQPYTDEPHYFHQLGSDPVTDQIYLTGHDLTRVMRKELEKHGLTTIAKTQQEIVNENTHKSLVEALIPYPASLFEFRSVNEMKSMVATHLGLPEGTKFDIDQSATTTTPEEANSDSLNASNNNNVVGKSTEEDDSARLDDLNLEDDELSAEHSKQISKEEDEEEEPFLEDPDAEDNLEASDELFVKDGEDDNADDVIDASDNNNAMNDGTIRSDPDLTLEEKEAIAYEIEQFLYEEGMSPYIFDGEDGEEDIVVEGEMNYATPLEESGRNLPRPSDLTPEQAQLLSDFEAFLATFPGTASENPEKDYEPFLTAKGIEWKDLEQLLFSEEMLKSLEQPENAQREQQESQVSLDSLANREEEEVEEESFTEDNFDELYGDEDDDVQGTEEGSSTPDIFNLNPRKKYWDYTGMNIMNKPAGKETVMSNEYPVSITRIHVPGIKSSPGAFMRTRKVVLKVRVSALNLTPPARSRLLELAGPRIQGDVLTLAIQRFPRASENTFFAKRLFQKLIEEAWKAEPNYVPLENLKEPTNILSPSVSAIFENPSRELTLLQTEYNFH